MTMWNFLDEVAPQYDDFLAVTPQEVMPWEGSKNQRLIFTDAGAPLVTSRSDSSVFYVQLNFKNISAASCSTIMSMYHDPLKANGLARSFKFTNNSESPARVYTVRFTGSLPGSVYAWGQHQVLSLKLLVEGKAPLTAIGSHRAAKATASRTSKATASRSRKDT